MKLIVNIKFQKYELTYNIVLNETKLNDFLSFYYTELIKENNENPEL